MHLIVEKSKENTVLPSVLRAAVHLFVKQGYEGTTIKDIAREAGASEGALYRHFKSKEELAWYIFSTHVNAFSMELLAKMSLASTSRDKIHAYITACFNAYEEDRDLFTYLIISEHRELANFPKDYTHPGHVALKFVQEEQGKGNLRSMNIYVAASILLGSVIRLCVTRIYGNISDHLKDHTDTVTESLWDALKK